MVGYLQKKNLIFYTPGKTGSVFALPAKQHTTIQQLLRTQEYLVKETKNPIVYIEDRREKARLQEWYYDSKGFGFIEQEDGGLFKL